jgi:hypothetical protein
MQEPIAGDGEIVIGGILPWAAVLVAGVLLTLVGQFLLDSFADSSAIGHWTQHAVLFWGGIMVGAGVLRLYQVGSRSN